MRHILILDFRPKDLFNKSHIRKSINVDNNTWGPVCIKKFIENYKSVYEGDDLRRVLFVDSEVKSELSKVD